MLIEYLMQYNEDELLYKKYYELRDKPEALADFLSSLDEEYVRSHYLLMKEFPFITITNFFSLKGQYYPVYMQAASEKKIYVTKHLRYTPVFSHSHDYFEVVYMLKGSCKQTLNNESLPLQEGDLCFIPPYQEHTLEIFDDSLAINILIQKENFEEILLPTLRSNTTLSDFFMSHLYSKNPMQRLVFMTGNDEAVRDDILEIYMETFSDDEYTQAIICHMLPIFFTHILRRHGRHINITNKEHRGNKQAIEIIRYIYNNYKIISLTQLAEHFHYSETHISRLIKNESGYNYKDFVRTVRLNQCKSLLLASSASIARIAEMVGYETPESLIRAFEKAFQMTPTQYRRIHAK